MADIKVELIKEDKKHKGMILPENTRKLAEEVLDKIKTELDKEKK